MKTCKVCGESKDLTEFYAHPSNKDGLYTSCKECWKNRSKKRYQENTDHVRGQVRKCLYGLDRESFEAMVSNQEGQCAICSTPMERPHVDHDHKTEKVRALLCRHCNVGLGHFFDSPELLNKASQYLVFHGN